jgi:hypothetical protein
MSDYTLYLQLDKYFTTYRYIPESLGDINRFNTDTWYRKRVESILEVTEDDFLWALVLVL